MSTFWMVFGLAFLQIVVIGAVAGFVWFLLDQASKGGFDDDDKS